MAARSSRKRAAGVPGLALAAVLALNLGCGTTVDRTQAQSALPGTVDGGTDPLGGNPVTDGTTGAPSVALPSSGPVTGAGGSGNAPRNDGQPAAPVAATQLPSAGTLLIGLPAPAQSCTGSCAAGDNALGIKGLGAAGTGGQGTAEQWQLLLKYVNARGGVLGRKLSPVFYTPDGNDGTAGEQATCTALTQDKHVFAAVIPMNHTPLIVNCLEKAGVVTVQQPGYMTSDAVHFAQHPHFLSSGGLNLTRLATVYVDGLFAQGFFGKGAVIGLVSWDTPEHGRAAGVVRQALAKHGLKLKEDFRTAPTYGLNDAGATASENQSAVLKFNTSGVNRVLFLGIGGSPGFFFLKAAEAQAYYPRYGLTSNDLPESLRVQATTQSFQGAMGVGWWPEGDVTGGKPTTAAAKQCEKLTGGTGDGPAYKACDALDIFVRAATAGGAALSAASVMRGLETLPVITPASMLRLQYGPGRHDGVAGARHFAYVNSCSCLRYSSSQYAL